MRGLELEVQPGTVLALLGANGAGKTTTLLTLGGLLAPLRGEVRVLGKALRPGHPHLVVRAGVTLVPDDKCLFTTLSVKDNLSFGCRGGAALEEALDYFPALQARLTAKAGVLSGGEQQMLALARALVSRPRVMLIDELSTGLAPLIVQEMLARVQQIAREKGTAVILVEQHAPMALGVADRAMVLSHGQVVWAGTAAALAADPGRLRAAYLGTGAAVNRTHAEIQRVSDGTRRGAATGRGQP